MEEVLNKLRELGVFIPEGLDDAQLTNLAKALCPWTMTITLCLAQDKPDYYLAYTRKGSPDSIAEAETPGLAGMKLVLKQLENKRYTATDTFYKQNAARTR